MATTKGTEMTSQEKQSVEFDSMTIGWVQVYREAQAKISEFEDIAGQARHKIEQAMGNAEIATQDGVKLLSWTHTPGAFRFDAIKAKAVLGADGYKAICTQGVASRRFVIEKDAK